MSNTIAQMLVGWNEQDLANLGKILEVKEKVDVARIAHTIKWLFHSRTMASTESFGKNFFSRVNKRPSEETNESLRAEPTYQELLDGNCKYLKAWEENSSEEEKEIYLSQAVIIMALQAMKPKERVKFFSSLVDAQDIAQGAKVPGTNLSGPMTTLALLGLAQASGFGVYVASTTALGLLTHAVGITLPFAAFTGLTSTIAFVIGPVGWLSAIAWGTWKVTQPEWKKITPVLIYIIARNSRERAPNSPHQLR